MQIKKRGMIKSILSNNGGETLVEVIVSFVVLLMIVAAVTTMIVSSVSFKNKAEEKSRELTAAANQIEASAHDGEYIGDSFSIDFLGQTMETPVIVVQEGSLYYFYSR